MEKLLNSELCRLTPEQYRMRAKRRIIMVLDNVRSAHNVGAAFRTADAFAIEKVVLCGICAYPPNPKLQKTALGAELCVEWAYFKHTLDALGALKEHGYNLIAVEQARGAVLLHDINHEEMLPAALIFGNEVNGVSQQAVDACDYCVEIPQYGTKHSLNVSVSMGVVLWEMCRAGR
jgi:tRNA G18 (ribose-2'-O)-methylase SpoU